MSFRKICRKVAEETEVIARLEDVTARLREGFKAGDKM
jgi:hypothetical protein